MAELSQSDKAAAQTELISLADLTTPYALRAAVGLGLPMMVKDGATTIEVLADRSGAPRRVVRSLVSYLALKGVFVRSSDESLARQSENWSPPTRLASCWIRVRSAATSALPSRAFRRP